MTIAETADAFRRLHEGPGAFVMPNPWDIGTTRILTGLGYEALATTSAGLAYSLGRRDGEAAVTRDEALEHAALIAGATELPVNGDLENGFGHDPESVAETIRGAAAAGLVGCSIEDSTSASGEPIYPLSQAVERIAAGVEAAPRPAVRVHADGARRELPARPQRPRRHDRAAAGLRQGGRRRALCAGAARHRGHPHGLCGGLQAGQRARAGRRAERRAAVRGRRSPHQPRLRVLQHRARGVPARGQGRARARDVRLPRRRRDLARPPALPGGAGAQLRGTRRRRGGCRYSTRTTAALLCVVSSPGNGPSNVPDVGGTSP